MRPLSADARPPDGGLAAAPGLPEVAREWGRIGVVGFGGPPAHVALLRALCVDRRRWIDARHFEDAIAATNLLPGPASTQLAIYCAWRLRGTAGALVGGLCFILPGLVLIIALAALFLSGSPPDWVRGAGAGAGAAVAAVAVEAGMRLALPAWRRARGAHRRRALAYAVARRRGGGDARAVARAGAARVRPGRDGVAPRGVPGGPPRRCRRPRCCSPPAPGRAAWARWRGRRSRWAPSRTAAAS